MVYNIERRVKYSLKVVLHKRLGNKKDLKAFVGRYRELTSCYALFMDRFGRMFTFRFLDVLDSALINIENSI